MKLKAYCAIRDQPVYRREVFVAGLKAAGYDVQPLHCIGSGKPGEVLVIWNRYGGLHETASRFEKNGGTVLVAENAYLGNDRSNRTRYAIARGGHNGQGEWYCGGPERWQNLGIALKPWRQEGEHVLVCPNRSFGRPGYIMPSNWPEVVIANLRTLTKRPIRLRLHPGNSPPKTPLSQDLKNAWAVVIWSSSVGCEALVEGIPVLCLSPAWILKSVTSPDLRNINDPPLLDRLPGFEKLAWAQWHIDEIASGEPFHYLRN